jgi:hypothetical protein
VNRLALDENRLALEPDRVTADSCEVAMPNGMTADLDGTLITCDQGGRVPNRRG